MFREIQSPWLDQKLIKRSKKIEFNNLKFNSYDYSKILVAIGWICSAVHKNLRIIRSLALIGLKIGFRL